MKKQLLLSLALTIGLIATAKAQNFEQGESLLNFQAGLFSKAGSSIFQKRIQAYGLFLTKKYGFPILLVWEIHTKK